MKASIILLVVVLVIAPPANAQQRTTGDVISENFNRGRQMREAMDARRQRAAESKRQEEAAKEEASFRRAQQEVALAKNNPALTLRSKNGLPDIQILNSPVALCAGSSKAAFTSSADGKSVFGCATIVEFRLEVDWAEFGKRRYNLEEWDQLHTGSADHVPLGG